MNVMRLSKPDASMASALSTVTMFSMPDTLTFAQCPVITIVFSMPLMLTVPSLQAIVLFSLMPP